MARLYILFFALNVLLLVLALISCLSAETGAVRTLPRFVWFLVIVLLPLVGAIAYFTAGRPVPAGTRQSRWRPGPGTAARPGQGRATRPRRALAPDDDPDFLRSIDGPRRPDGRRGDDEDLRRWEEDLKPQDKDAHKHEDTPPADG